MGITVSGVSNSAPLIVDAAGVRMANALPSTATAYKQGDLLVLSATNVLTLATDPAVWDVVAALDVTAAQATAHAAAGVEIPVYTQGAFNVDAVSLGGVLLANNQKAAARSRATKNKLEFRKVLGV